MKAKYFLALASVFFSIILYVYIYIYSCIRFAIQLIFILSSTLLSSVSYLIFHLLLILGRYSCFNFRFPSRFYPIIHNLATHSRNHFLEISGGICQKQERKEKNFASTISLKKFPPPPPLIDPPICFLSRPTTTKFHRSPDYIKTIEQSCRRLRLFHHVLPSFPPSPHFTRVSPLRFSSTSIASSTHRFLLLFPSLRDRRNRNFKS